MTGKLEEILSIQIDDYKYELQQSYSSDPSSKTYTLYAMMSWNPEKYNIVRGSRKIPVGLATIPASKRVLGSWDYHYSPESMKNGLINGFDHLLQEIKESTEKLINEFEEIYLIQVSGSNIMDPENPHVLEYFEFYSGSININEKIHDKILNELSRFCLIKMSMIHNPELINELYSNGEINLEETSYSKITLKKTKVSDLEIIG